MSTYTPCKARFSILKNYPTPKNEPDLKLQSLLVYILDRLSQGINVEKVKELERTDRYIQILNNDEMKKLNGLLHQIVNILNLTVPNYDEMSKQLGTILSKDKKSSIDNIIISEYTYILRLYNHIVEYFGSKYNNEEYWIPELVSLSLLVYWFAEYRKMTLTYNEVHEALPLIIEASEIYNYSKDNRKNVNNMHDVALEFIKSYSELKYKSLIPRAKISSKKNSKKRKRRK